MGQKSDRRKKEYSALMSIIAPPEIKQTATSGASKISTSGEFNLAFY